MNKRMVTRLGVSALCLGISQATLGLDARIEGIDGEVADNVEVYLEDLDAAQYSPARLRSEVLRLAQEAMRVFGYYEPDLSFSMEDPENPERITLTVEPGEPVTIEVLDLAVTGAARDDEPFQEALADFPLEVGDPLRHAPFDSLRSRLAGLALERGYFGWRFTERRMEVRPWAGSARLYLALDSGPRYRFGDIRFQGHHIEADRLRRLAPFERGTPYLAADLALFNQRLGQTEWFASVSARPRLDSERGRLALEDAPLGWWQALDLEGEGRAAPASPRISADALVASASVNAPAEPYVPIDVVVTPADRHQFELGLGYATDVGPRVRLTWDQPWINRYGHSLSHDLYLSAPEQQFTGTYEMPLDDPLRDRYRLQYGVRSKDNEDTRTLESTVEAGRLWTFDNGWEQWLYLRATYEDFTQAGVSNEVLLLYPGVRWSRTRTRNPTFPTWGDRQRVSIEYSSDAWGSDAEFLRLTGNTEWIRMLGQHNRFVGRVGLGSVITDDFRDVPPSLRFFTGGDRSVRGYAYESLAPEDDDGELIGGEQLLTASLEAQRRITGPWWGAAFVDTGDAFTDWGPEALSTGAGLGVRWVSPVGPIRLDIAHPFDHEDAFRIHFAIGPEF